MIKFYSQYSYGGYKTFFIEGLENEPMQHEVTNEETYGFPSDAHVYFQFGGAKLVYRTLTGGEIALVIREMPSVQTDSDGRSIPCALQFIGDSNDRKIMDNLALTIANNISEFEQFFSRLFYVRDGLRISGDKLREYVTMCAANSKPLGREAHPAFKSMSKKNGGVFLFVPLSAKFGNDKTVTQTVCKELRLDYSDVKAGCISVTTLFEQQGKILSITEETPDRRDDTVTNSQIGSDKNSSSEEGDGMRTKYDAKARECDNLRKKNKWLTYGLFGLGGVFVLSLLFGTCSGCKKKEKTKENVEDSISVLNKGNSYNYIEISKYGTKVSQS